MYRILKSTEKRLIAFMLCLGLMFSFAVLPAAAAETDRNGAPDVQTASALSGKGTAASPYLIKTEADLMSLAAGTPANAYNSYYTLSNDITLTATHWTPIGGNGVDEFSGVFDGAGHTISGLVLADMQNSDYMSGLFGVSSGTIKNLKVKGKMTGSIDSDDEGCSGLLLGCNTGTVSGCYSEGSITTVSGRYVGGLVGRSQGKVTLSGAKVTVTAPNSVSGGLIGQNCEGSVEYSYATGAVSGINAGGLEGEQIGNSTANCCYATGKVTASERAGGLIGHCDGGENPKVTYCYATGLAESEWEVSGGLIGSRASWIECWPRFCYFNKTNSSENGGFPVSLTQMKDKTAFFGWDFDHIWTISSSANGGYPTIKLNGTPSEVTLKGAGDEEDPYLIHNEKELWQLVLNKGDYKPSIKNHYKLANDITLTANYWTPIGGNGANEFSGVFDGAGHTISGLVLIDMQSSDYMSGLFGISKGTIKNLKVKGKMTGSIDSDDEGCSGLLLGCNTGTVTGCYAEGNITTESGRYVGGLVGRSQGKVTLSSAKVTVTAPNSVSGGLIGQNCEGSVEYSYATGAVSGINAGGLEGEQIGNSTANCCYATGKVTASERAGGLIGHCDGGENPKVTYCYATGLAESEWEVSGGLIGSIASWIECWPRFCYFNKANSSENGGFAVSLAQMKDKSTFSGWDFTSVWNIDSSLNSGYPYLRKNNTFSNVSVTGVSLNKTTLSLTKGSTETLTATVAPSNATVKTVSWSSSNTAVATVSSSGVVKAVGEGTATITVKTTDGGKTATCKVTVVPDRVPGDVNNDGKVTTMDATLIKRKIVGGFSIPVFNEANADVNGDGKVTTMDATLIKRYIGDCKTLRKHVNKKVSDKQPERNGYKRR